MTESYEQILDAHPRLSREGIRGLAACGLPSPEIMQVVQGYSLLRTGYNGWIHLGADGEQMQVEVERR